MVDSEYIEYKNSIFVLVTIYILLFQMKTTTEILELLREFKARSAEKYGILSLGLFGSVARGEHRAGSDIDVFVKLRRPNLFLRMAIKEELEALFHTKVDVVSLTAIMQTLFKKELEHDAIYI